MIAPNSLAPNCHHNQIPFSFKLTMENYFSECNGKIGKQIRGFLYKYDFPRKICIVLSNKSKYDFIDGDDDDYPY